MNVKKILLIGNILFFINQFGQYPYFSFYNHLKTNFKKEIDYSTFTNLSKKYDALDFLNLSTEEVQKIKEGNCFCGDYANETFDVYMELVEINNRSDLTDKIRLAAGSVIEKKGLSGHVWIEVKGSPWKAYNPQYPRTKDTSKEANFDMSGIGEIEDICFITLPGKKISIPHDLGINSLNPLKRGCLRFLYDIRSDIKKRAISYSNKNSKFFKNFYYRNIIN